MLFAGVGLASRIEAADARIAAEAAESHARRNPQGGACVLSIAGGQAAFTEPGSPLTHLIGAGFSGPVIPDEIERLEAFYRDRACTAVNIDLCPLAHPSLADVLFARGYRIVEFNNVLARRLAVHDRWPEDARVRRAAADEAHLWSTTVMGGFFEKPAPSPVEAELGFALFGMSSTFAFIGSEGGVPASGAALFVQGGLAYLMADSTVVRFRGRRLHRALIEARLQFAVYAGCDLAVATTLAGSISQRSYQRCGFEVLYTNLNMQRDYPDV